MNDEGFAESAERCWSRWVSSAKPTGVPGENDDSNSGLMIFTSLLRTAESSAVVQPGQLG